VESSWTPLTALAALWLVAFSTQLADFATARFDHLRLARGVRTRMRLHPVAWVFPAAGIALVVAAVGVDWSTRLFFDDPSQIPAAALVTFSTVVVLVAVAAIVTVVVVSPPTDSFRLVRDELIELTGVRLHQDQVDEFHARVAAIDAASKHRRSSDATTIPAAVQRAVRAPQRLIAPAISLAVAVVALVDVANSRVLPWVIVVAVLTVVASFILGIVAARASVALRMSVRSTQEVYRRELLSLIVEAEKSSKKRVAGLGDRVTRALSILREQQASQ
jgi:hypothetical protein